MRRLLGWKLVSVIQIGTFEWKWMGDWAGTTGWMRGKEIRYGVNMKCNIRIIGSIWEGKWNELYNNR